MCSRFMKQGASLPAIAFVVATIGGVVIPLFGSLAAIILGTIANKRTAPLSEPQAHHLASLSILFGWGGLACWVLLLAAFFLGT